MKCWALLTVACFCSVVTAQTTSLTPTIENVTLAGRIDGANLSFDLAFDVTTRRADEVIELLKGDVVVESVSSPATGARLGYDAPQATYSMAFGAAGRRHVALTFSARANPVGETAWRESAFGVPASDVREVTLACDRADLELDLPGAVRVTRQVDDGRLTVTAVQGAQRVFSVRWKPQVQALDAELVVAANVHTIASLGVASLRIDNVFTYEIAQGKLDALALLVPEGVNVTAVRGKHIRDWSVAASEPGKTSRTLTVTLNRAQTGSYMLQVVAETPVPALPAALDVPVVEPMGVIRASGHLAVGTDHAIQMVVRQSSSLSQVDAGAMPKVVFDASLARPMPTERAFHYSFTTVPYRLRLALDRIVPAFDAAYRMVVGVSEDDLAIDAEVELDVRDAPIREAMVNVPAGFAVVGVVGAQVEDYRVIEKSSTDQAGSSLRVQFREPVLGRSAFRLRLELGRTPLDGQQSITAMTVADAKAQRGHIIIAVEDGIRVDPPVMSGQSIREINTASAPMRVATAQFAYRFRDIDWQLQLRPARKPAGVRNEAFHLVTIGEGVAVTSAAFSYFITGSPIDRFDFVIDPRVENVEFVGADVRRWDRDAEDPSRWTVTLQRKVEGDFNLGLTFSQPLREPEAGGDAPLLIAAAMAADVESQAGFVALASHLHVNVTPLAAGPHGLIEINRDELPANYRLLVSAPLLRSFKHVGEASPSLVNVQTYDRGTLLPAVVEFAQIESWIVPRAGDRAESHTRVRYIVKNSSQQFLTLKMPQGVEVWSARQLDDPAAASDAQGRRLAMVRDDTAGLLMVPIPRPRDPNSPITIEVEYGQVHPSLGWGGRIDVAAPQTGADGTFDQWHVHVPADWAISPANGGDPTLKPAPRLVRRGDLRAVLHGVGASWADGLERALRYPAYAIVGIIVAAVVLLTAIFSRRHFGDVAMLLAALIVVGVGVMAASGTTFAHRIHQPDDLTSVTFTRVIDLKEGEPLVALARVVPLWRQNLGFVSMVIVPAVALVCLIGASLAPGRRAALIALGVTGLLLSVSRLPQATPWLGHAMTWGLPVLLAVLAAIRLARRAKASPPPVADMGGVPAVTATLLLAVMLLSGCAATDTVEIKLDTVALQRLDVTMSAEADAMSVEMRVEAVVDKPTRVTLLDDRTILLSAEPRSQVLSLQRSDKGYDLVMKAAGRHTMTVRCLRPMPAADDSQLRRFDMALPQAMSKRMTLTLPQTGVDVVATTAIRQERREADGTTVVEATLGPNDPIDLAWRPRERQREREATSFFATVTGVHRLDTGVVSGVHEIRLQIAQGQLDRLQAVVPAEFTVTALQGEAIGAWRFDSQSRLLDVRLARPASGDYALRVHTQMPVGAMPFRATFAPLRVREAVRQTASVGLATTDAVFAAVESGAPALNADDFARDVQSLLAALGPVQGVRAAYRMDDPRDTMAATLAAVEPELRTLESASFTVTDERLVYNGRLTLAIAKAGVFSANLLIPDGYDIDALAAPQVGHWDESVVDGRRVATVHFTNRVLGDVPLQLTLSRPVAGLPSSLDVPRLEVPGVLKHTGQVVITADRGVRLAVSKREGVSELDPASLGVGDANAIVFRLLRPTWSLQLSTEQVEPRISVEALHVARVGDGLVRHTHHLRYAFHHAGSKIFDVRLPVGAAAVLIQGPRIARVQPLDTPDTWRVELTGRWFDTDGQLPLTVQYETLYDGGSGELALQSVRTDASLQRGYVVVFGGERVELSAAATGASLQSADARTLPREFGAGDLSSAALCYRSATGDYTLRLNAARRPAAALLEADVQAVTIDTVVTEHGQTISDVLLQLRVAGKRDLQAALPGGAEVWSLLVNGRAVVPSIQTDAANRRITLIPLAQTASGDLPVEVQLTYVTPATAASRWSRPRLEGPRFDLPLKNVTWRLFVPDDFVYRDFDGTLDPVRERIDEPVFTRYDVSAYNRQNELVVRRNLQKAVEAQTQAATLAEQGQQRAARQQLESAWFYSQSDVGLNEDARVQLHRLAKEQALVGLVGNRNRLRQQTTPAPESDPANAPANVSASELGEEFSRSQVDRLRGALAKPDSDNLDLICARIVDAQQAITGAPVALAVSIPFRGRMIEFTRAIQVEPDAAMHVSFTAATPRVARLDTPPVWAAAVFVALLLSFIAIPRMLSAIDRLSGEAV